MNLMTDYTQEDEPEARLATLTPGELQCLELVATGMVSKEIARLIDVSPHTVDARLRVVTRKLGARNRFVAAQLFHEARKNGSFAGGLPLSELIYEDLNLPAGPHAVKMRPSTGEGNGPDDLQPRPALAARRSSAGGQGAWLKPSHPFAKFFGGENRLDIGRRLLLILAIAIGTAMAFTAVVNSLIGLSRLISPP